MKHLQLLIGTALSVVCGYLAIRGVEWSAVWDAFGRVQPWALLPATLCMAAILGVRAYRWQCFITPTQDVPLRPFLMATLIGFMANDILPLRMGEIVRAYALAQLSPVRMSTALATAVLERVWDAVMIAVLLVCSLSSFPLPPWLSRATWSVLVTGVVVLAAGWWIARKERNVFAWLPPRLAAVAVRFVEGLKSLHSFALVVWVAALSLGIWLLLAIFYWIMLWACGFALPVQAALMVTVVTVFAVALPAAPGYVGTFQYATVVALSFFAVPKEDALGFSIIVHLAQIVPVVVGGLIALVRTRLSLWPVGQAASTQGQGY